MLFSYQYPNDLRTTWLAPRERALRDKTRCYVVIVLDSVCTACVSAMTFYVLDDKLHYHARWVCRLFG